jgi:hypothetical protein
VATGSRRSCGAPSTKVACHPKPVRAKGGGDGGIRTLDRALQPYNGLANRRLQPLGHISGKADMPDTGASRKRQISGGRIRNRFNDSGKGHHGVAERSPHVGGGTSGLESVIGASHLQRSLGKRCIWNRFVDANWIATGACRSRRLSRHP